MAGAEPGPDARVDEIQSDIEHTRAQLGETVDALTAKVDRTKAAAKLPLAVVASVAGATVVAIFWWRRRSRRRAG
jgi:hypothetical protein